MSERSSDNDEQFASTVPSTVYGGNLTHVHNDSSFSMDSFVQQARPAVGDDADETEEEGKLDDSISSIPNRDDRNSHSRRNSSGQSSADSGMPHPPSPVHNFFKEYAFPSGEDAPSDGSIVFNYTPPPAVQSLSRNDRSRFPSFDSIGSSGSVVRKVPPQHNGKPKSSSTPTGQQRTKILPYHERRKLMQQQQAQEQQKRPAPPRPRPPANTSQPPFMMPPQPPFPPPHTTPQLFPPFPPPQAYGIQPLPHNFVYPPPPLPPIGIPLYPPPPGLHPTSSPMDPPQQPPQPFAVLTDGGKISDGDIPPASGSKLYNPRRQSAGSQYARPPIQPLPPYQRSMNSGGSLLPSQQQQEQPLTIMPNDSLSYAASSSFDSSEGNNETRKDLPPPPPPPPLPPPTAHIRQDSSGSVSSLGSVDRGSGTEHQKQPEQQQQQQHRARSFFDRISPWKTAPPPSKEHSVRDFHRINQDFLSKVEKQNSPQLFLSSGSPVSTAQHRMPLSTSMDRPPPSRGGHRRLNSIENDDWTDEPDEEDPLLSKKSDEDDATKKRSGAGRNSRRRGDYGTTTRGMDSSNQYSSSEESVYSDNEAEERRHRRPLPPSGISTNEYYDRRYQDSMRTSPYSNSPSPYGSTSGSSNYWQVSPESGSRGRSHETTRLDNTLSGAWNNFVEHESAERLRQKKKKNRKKRRSRLRRHANKSDSSTSSSSSAGSPPDPWKAKYFEEEKARIIESWNKEAREEAERNSWYRRLRRYLKSVAGHVAVQLFIVLAWTESFIGNLPLTIGAIALASANLGVDWFKFAEENLSSCEPVHFHSKQCNFPEFPGCFYCDTSNRMYQVAVHFHFACSCFAGLLAFSFIAKIILAPRVVFDNLSSPTTASPAGLLCMTLNIVFAGRGVVGMFVVSAVSCIHLCLAIWFMYMALAYHIMPEPSWFPNTTGIGLSAVKTWLYHPMAGHFLMAISLTLNFFFFPTSLIRVFLNRKISAPVGWMQMSAPNISLYALTIMAQPSFMEENPDVNNFQKLHRRVYLPCMHFLFSLCLIGMAASVTSLVVRWEEFKKQPFSPAHSAFLCPTLSHANAVQAYRGSLNAFSTLHRNGLPMRLLYTYWIVVLVSGTLLYLCIATRFLLKLPEWTHFDLEDEIEPPAPYETAMTLSNMVQTGETLVQPFVSPAILQANETGTLVLTRDRQGRQKYVRTRKVTALGFEPIMDIVRMEEERDILLDWVSANKPRRRHRTLSVPGIDFNYGAVVGTGTGVYGVGQSPQQMRPSIAEPRQGSGRARSYTMSPRVYRERDL